MIVVEIGVGFGATAAEILPIITANDGQLVVVDNFCGGPGFEGQGEEMKRAIRMLINTYSRTAVLEGLSWEMARHMPDKNCDIVFIDGDHRYSSVVKDIIAWAPKIRKGKILAGHDCNNLIGDYNPAHIEEDWIEGKHHGVIKAVSEMINDADLINNCTWWTRNTKINFPMEYWI
jgi:hypothetical protein